MRVVVFCLIVCAVSCCDSARVYEKNHDFSEPYWLVAEKPSFDFSITDTTQTYTLYCAIRSSVAYPYSRIFINYSFLTAGDSLLKKDMISGFLFDEKTGRPLGSSGLGDLYDQQFVILQNQSFKKPGEYKVQFEQFMRTDTLSGILAVGLRVEKTVTP